MADSDNFSNMSENFDTIKTLLNSIRAQGILNTSDVDKLLTGINTKLERINTGEDIGTIKLFLTELKQNLDERHNILISKFGAIESLFSNLLKNSSEMPKSAELKELFDIVATNLSVFSKEVVSQKETLTDITLRLDALRTDDSQKKDIIKNISLLKPDLEHLNNGFDSIVLSLNDNFKTIVKTITTLDKSEYLDNFAGTLSGIEMSSNTVLSAIQMLDKKAEQVDESLKNLATKDDMRETSLRLVDLTVQGQELSSSVNNLSERYFKVDNLADKIDASVNIIAGLKAVLEDADDKSTKSILDKLSGLELELKNISSDTKFEDFKSSLELVLKSISESSVILDKNLNTSLEEVQKLVSGINSLGADISAIQDAGINRVLNDISAGADSLNSKLNLAQVSITALCEKNFNSVFENITGLKTAVSQLDENRVSANGAIFSSITDRLNLFENWLKESLETQEKTLSSSSGKLDEQIENIKNISGVLDYKMDSSVVEIANVKNGFESLKTAIDSMLALDFVNAVKDLKVDLYASKQEVFNAFETSAGEISEKMSNDIYSKYELLISKLDFVENEFKQAQTASLTEIKGTLESISSSIVDILSYVSERSSLPYTVSEISNLFKENKLNYAENIKEIIDAVKIQVEAEIQDIVKENSTNLDSVKKAVSENSEDLKNDIKYSYSKLLEIQDCYKEIKELLNINSINNSGKFDNIIASAEGLRADFDTKLKALKSAMLDKISEFKTEFASENAGKADELKLTADNIYSNNLLNSEAFINDLKKFLDEKENRETNYKTASLSKILDNFVSIRNLMKSLTEQNIENTVNNTSLILDNFEIIKDTLASLNERPADELNRKLDVIIACFSGLKSSIEKVDENVDNDMTRQLSLIESNFESLVSQIVILFDKSDKSLSERINEEFSDISGKMENSISEKLETYKLVIEQTFDKILQRADSQVAYIQDRITDLNTALKSVWEKQSEDNYKQIEEIAGKLKAVSDENVKLTAADYMALKSKLNEFTNNIETANHTLAQDLKEQLSSLSAVSFDGSSRLLTSLDSFTAENAKKLDFLTRTALNNNSRIESLDASLKEHEEGITNKLANLAAEISAGELQSLDVYVNNILEQIEAGKQTVQLCKNLIVDSLNKELDLISKSIEKETDIITGELIEQFELLKASQADEAVNLVSKTEEIVSTYIYNNIEDLKAYLDIKTDTSVLAGKLDNLKMEVSSSAEELLSNMNKFLESGVFSSVMSDYKRANEILVNSAISKLNDKIEKFISSNADELAGNTKNVADRLALFDKKFTDTIIDKYEEIKLISNKYNDAFNSIRESLNDILAKFEIVKESISGKIDSLAGMIKTASESTGRELSYLNNCFENLRTQISNKSFDEAFQASINKQISSLEDLISEQMEYIADINELCENNLPELTEMNTLVKHSLIKSISDLTDKIEGQNIEENLLNGLKAVKSDIITQFLNVFNQISFVTEQEEILDFIHEKHEALITILSHIVTSSDEIGAVKENVSVVDNKINLLKDNIEIINEKINSIISAGENIDYVYSLQDLESDIANLRSSLNDMKENNHGKEFENLINSTNEIYKLVESVKSELPNKSDFEGIAEDIISISTRTNKLILASDESYKTLQDNLRDFKLVINDFDERTRNFAHESGIDRIDSKLNALNSMMVSGAKTTKVFNQVFEYLAEWVDNASIQISSISDRVETLDDIGQIKLMLEDLKAETDDNSESIELIEALSAVFDKQTKRISSLEAKLDKIIVENTINNKNKLDITPMEDTLNRFLVAVDDKMSYQQDKIKSLESKLEGVMSLLDEKDTEQLTKKVGGMDRQIAKLNKSIEKIASHVIER